MKDKVVIITGGSSGIGRACAEVFGIYGSKIVITGRNRQNLMEAVDYLKNLGVEVHAILSDVSDEKDCERMVKETLSVFGRLDILINNAGISMRALFIEMDLAVMKKVMDINFHGTVYSTKYALPEIIKNKGSIIGISSIAGYRGLPGRTGYSASKFAMQGFLESLRTELLRSGVHVLVACPGFTDSNIRRTALSANGSSQGESPLKESKLMSPKAVAVKIYKATLKRQRDLIMTGQGKMTVFLNKLFPGFMDTMVFNHFKKEENSPLK